MGWCGYSEESHEDYVQILAHVWIPAFAGTTMKPVAIIIERPRETLTTLAGDASGPRRSNIRKQDLD